VPSAPIAEVSVVVAWAWLWVKETSNDLMKAPRAALPGAEVSLASSAASSPMYDFMPASALAFGSDSSGVSLPATPAAIGLMIVQSAADGLLAEPAELAGADAAGDDAAVVAAGAEAVAVELDELDELLHPATRAALAARTARAQRDERWDISGTSMGPVRSIASDENLVVSH
jgi:hypothetical protein